jgi:ABC-type molybdate transport system substrate-binding protein
MSRPVITRAHASALFFGAAALGSIRFPSAAQTNVPLKIIGSVAVKAALDPIVSLFEKTSGHNGDVEYGTAEIPSKIAAGETFDVVIAGIAAVDALVKGGFVLPNSDVMFGTPSLHSLIEPGPETGHINARCTQSRAPQRKDDLV